jgi:hypothetical protein
MSNRDNLLREEAKEVERLPLRRVWGVERKMVR